MFYLQLTANEAKRSNVAVSRKKRKQVWGSNKDPTKKEGLIEIIVSLNIANKWPIVE